MSTNLIYLAGYYANAMRRATSFTPSQAAHALYPASNLGAGLPSKPFKFNAVGTNVYVIADINFLLNQGLEGWTIDTLPDDWIEGAGAGSIAKESGTKDEGSYSAKITGEKDFYQDVRVLTGKDYTIGAALHGDAGGHGAYVYVQDLDTYKWLNTSQAWAAGKTHALVETGNAWDDESAAFSVESPSNRKYYTDLRIYCAGEAGGAVYVDDLFFIPKVSFMSVHGHNLPSGATLNLRASTDNFGGSDEDIATPVMAQPAFYKTFTAVAYRYWKLLVASQAVGDPIWIGEWVLGPHNTLGKNMRYGWTLNNRQPRTTARMATSGQVYGQRDAYRPSRDVAMEFMTDTESVRDEVLEQVLEASEWADEPLVFAPDTEDEIVIHGRVGQTFPYTTDCGGAKYIWRYGVNIEEDAFPVAGF